jgi:hypothetical protein
LASQCLACLAQGYKLGNGGSVTVAPMEQFMCVFGEAINLFVDGRAMLIRIVLADLHTGLTQCGGLRG